MSYTPEDERLDPVLIPLAEALAKALPELQRVYLAQVRADYAAFHLQELATVLGDAARLYQAVYKLL